MTTKHIEETGTIVTSDSVADMMVEHLHMANGDGENSYATNSRLQEKAILETRPVLQNAVVELYASQPHGSTMVVADLGCSSGPNTLRLVSEVIGTITDYTMEAGQCPAVEVQFFLNDLPGNDFNLVFRSLGRLKKLTGKIVGKAAAVPLPLYYVAGMPGSFYTRLFPCQSVHLFHSSYSLMWRSKESGIITDQSFMAIIFMVVLNVAVTPMVGMGIASWARRSVQCRHRMGLQHHDPATELHLVVGIHSPHHVPTLAFLMDSMRWGDADGHLACYAVDMVQLAD